MKVNSTLNVLEWRSLWKSSVKRKEKSVDGT